MQTKYFKVIALDRTVPVLYSGFAGRTGEPAEHSGERGGERAGGRSGPSGGMGGPGSGMGGGFGRM